MSSPFESLIRRRLKSDSQSPLNIIEKDKVVVKSKSVRKPIRKPSKIVVESKSSVRKPIRKPIRKPSKIVVESKSSVRKPIRKPSKIVVESKSSVRKLVKPTLRPKPVRKIRRVVVGTKSLRKPSRVVIESKSAKRLKKPLPKLIKSVKKPLPKLIKAVLKKPLKPVPKSIKKPVPKSIKPVPKSIKPVPKPLKPVPKSIKPVPKSIKKPVPKSIKKSVPKSIKKSVPKPIKKPVLKKPIKKPVLKKPIKKPVRVQKNNTKRAAAKSLADEIARNQRNSLFVRNLAISRRPRVGDNRESFIRQRESIIRLRLKQAENNRLIEARRRRLKLIRELLEHDESEEFPEPDFYSEDSEEELPEHNTDEEDEEDEEELPEHDDEEEEEEPEHDDADKAYEERVLEALKSNSDLKLKTSTLLHRIRLLEENDNISTNNRELVNLKAMYDRIDPNPGRLRQARFKFAAHMKKSRATHDPVYDFFKSIGYSNHQAFMITRMYSFDAYQILGSSEELRSIVAEEETPMSIFKAYHDITKLEEYNAEAYFVRHKVSTRLEGVPSDLRIPRIRRWIRQLDDKLNEQYQAMRYRYWKGRDIPEEYDEEEQQTQDQIFITHMSNILYKKYGLLEDYREGLEELNALGFVDSFSSTTDAEKLIARIFKEQVELLGRHHVPKSKLKRLSKVKRSALIMETGIKHLKKKAAKSREWYRDLSSEDLFEQISADYREGYTFTRHVYIIVKNAIVASDKKYVMKFTYGGINKTVPLRKTGINKTVPLRKTSLDLLKDLMLLENLNEESVSYKSDEDPEILPFYMIENFRIKELVPERVMKDYDGAYFNKVSTFEYSLIRYQIYKEDELVYDNPDDNPEGNELKEPVFFNATESESGSEKLKGPRLFSIIDNEKLEMEKLKMEKLKMEKLKMEKLKMEKLKRAAHKLFLTGKTYFMSSKEISDYLVDQMDLESKEDKKTVEKWCKYVERQDKMRQIRHCLVYALLTAGIEEEDMMRCSDLYANVKKQNLPMTILSEVSVSLGIHIELYKYDNFGKIRTSDYNEGAEKKITLALYNSHYFVYENTAFSKKHLESPRAYEKGLENPDLFFKGAKINSLVLVKMLDDLGLFEYSNKLLGNFEQLSEQIRDNKLLVNMKNEQQLCMTKSQKELAKALARARAGKKPSKPKPKPWKYVFVADTETGRMSSGKIKDRHMCLYNAVKLIYCSKPRGNRPLPKFHEVFKRFSLGPEWTFGKKSKCKSPSHRMLMKIAAFIQDEEFRVRSAGVNFPGVEVSIYYHNLKYDLHVMMEEGIKFTKNCEQNGQIYSASTIIGPTFMTLKDSYKVITMPLGDFGSAFNLQVEKMEAIAYDAYTIEKYDEYCENNILGNVTAITVGEYMESMNKANVNYIFPKDATSEQQAEIIEKMDTFAYVNLRSQLIKNIMKIPGCLVANNTDPDQIRFRHWHYYEYYLEQDVNTLGDGMLKFRAEMLKALKVDVFEYLTMSGLSLGFLKEAGCYSETYEVKGLLKQYLSQAIYGGRVILGRGFQRKRLREFITALDMVSLYPSAIRAMKGKYGCPKGMAKEIIGEFTPDEYSYYVVTIDIHTVNRQRKIPLICKRTDGESLSYTNDPPGVVTVDMLTLEDYIKYHDIEYDFVEGVYWDEGFDDLISDKIYEMFQMRLQAKQEGNSAKATILKGGLNQSYGRNLMKPHNKTTTLIDSDKADNYLYRHWNRIRKDGVKELANGQSLFNLDCVDKSFTTPHVGILILSMSKRIMNEIFDVMEINNIPLYYSDTDSIHFPDKHLQTLYTAYAEIYGRPLEGEDMGDAHVDFELKYTHVEKCSCGDVHEKGCHGIVTSEKKARDVIATEAIYYDRKVYCEKLQGVDHEGNMVFGYNFRMKGFNSAAVKAKAAECFNGNLMDLYAYICHTPLAIDNVLEGGAPRFKYEKYQHVFSAETDIRTIGGDTSSESKNVKVTNPLAKKRVVIPIKKIKWSKRVIKIKQA